MSANSDAKEGEAKVCTEEPHKLDNLSGQRAHSVLTRPSCAGADTHGGRLVWPSLLRPSGSDPESVRSARQKNHVGLDEARLNQIRRDSVCINQKVR